MSEQQQGTAKFALQRIYLKDLSFESPRAPEAFRIEWSPQVNMELNARHERLDENVYEVVLSITISAQDDDENVFFLVELQQAGIFHIEGLGEEPLKQTLGSFCPSVLFPYARETVDSLVVKGSFPPLMLAPVNFDAIYAETQKRLAESGSVTH